MEEEMKRNIQHRLPSYLLITIWSALLVLQLGAVFFVFNEPSVPWLFGLGWGLWALGCVFALVPIMTLRVRGRVPAGKSYMETTALVDTGIYAIVRHPQGGTAGLLFNLALPLIGQHWLLLALAPVGMALIYIGTFNSDRACIAKFGQAYVRYMARVPRVNFVVGIMRLFRNQKLGMGL
jgi:protein-S-isoprenylcysteine O-methyltransferase Ste14